MFFQTSFTSKRCVAKACLTLVASLVIGGGSIACHGQQWQKTRQSQTSTAQESLVPSPLNKYQALKPQPSPMVRLIQELDESENRDQQKVILETRRLVIPEGQQLKIADVVKPGSFEIFMTALPTKAALTTDSSHGLDLFSAAEIKTEKSTTAFAVAAERTNRPRATVMAKLDNDGMRKMVGAVSRAGGTVTQSPTCTTYSSEIATCSDYARRPFVIGIEPKVNGDRVAYQPKIQLIEDGTVFQYLPKIDGETVALKADILVSKIVGVEQQVLPVVGVDGQPMSIQVPEQSIASVHLDSLLENNETLFVDPQHFVETETVQKNVLGKETAIVSKSQVCYLVTVRIVDVNVTSTKPELTKSQSGRK